MERRGFLGSLAALAAVPAIAKAEVAKSAKRVESEDEITPDRKIIDCISAGEIKAGDVVRSSEDYHVVRVFGYGPLPIEPDSGGPLVVARAQMGDTILGIAMGDAGPGIPVRVLVNQRPVPTGGE